MAERKPHRTPVKANAERGEVLIDGPGSVAVSLTPAAARASARAIADAAQKSETPDDEDPAD